MFFFQSMYNNICNKCKINKSLYTKGSGIHEHHIIPKHQGGSNNPENLTYLTVRQHIIAHFLLWKINKNPNDLRSMYMLGAKLTPHQRILVGEWCRDNKIGFHGWTKKQRQEVGKRVFEYNPIFAYWASPEGRKERSRMGGLASFKSGNNKEFAYWASPEGRRKRAMLGAAASPRLPVTDGCSTKKFFTEEERQRFIIENEGWKVGYHKTKSSSCI